MNLVPVVKQARDLTRRVQSLVPLLVLILVEETQLMVVVGKPRLLQEETDTAYKGTDQCTVKLEVGLGGLRKGKGMDKDLHR